MADKKFGQKRVCPHCEKKFYDLNKKSPYKCPCGEKEIVIEEEMSILQIIKPIQQPKKQNKKMNLQILKMQITDADEDDDGVISLDDAALEEEQVQKIKF